MLHLLKNREVLMLPLAQSLVRAADVIEECRSVTTSTASGPCSICADTRRDASALCVVGDISDLWAIEKTGAFKGYYHVLGGTLSALDGIAPKTSPSRTSSRVRGMKK